MKDDRVYLWHIRDCIERIVDYTREGRDAFLNDPKTQDAVIRNLEIIGEAVKNVSEDLKKFYPDIPWPRIAGMRDRMIHEYFGLDGQSIKSQGLTGLSQQMTVATMLECIGGLRPEPRSEQPLPRI